MALKTISSRQINNMAALPNIGTPAFDTLDDILAHIDAALAGVTSASGYFAQQVSLTSGITSYAVTIPVQLDTSYVVYPMLENVVDTFPQFQQPLIINKTVTGFTVQFNAPLESNNYILTYVVPYKVFLEGEVSVPFNSSSNSVTLPLEQSSSIYGLISMIEDYNDSFPQYQTAIVTGQGPTAFVSSTNAPTTSSNYVTSYMVNATSRNNVGMSAVSVGVNFPINYNTTSYAVVAMMYNFSDANPQFQPLLVTSKTNSGCTFSWNAPTNTSNYVLSYYVISLTP